MSHPRKSSSRLDLRTIAIVLATTSLACGEDDPFTAGPQPSAIEMIAGDEQTGRVSEELPDSLVVRVLDEEGRPLEGVSVVWVAQGGGSVSPDTVSTDSDGNAAAQRVLGETVGQQTTTATVSEMEDLQVTFSSNAVAPPPQAP